MGQSNGGLINTNKQTSQKYYPIAFVNLQFIFFFIGERILFNVNVVYSRGALIRVSLERRCVGAESNQHKDKGICGRTWLFLQAGPIIFSFAPGSGKKKSD